LSEFFLILVTFLCSLVAGLLFAFAIVVMPGIKNLNDKGFIRAFQVIDGVIQNNQPLFMLAWVGSILVLIVTVVLAIGQLGGVDLLILIAAAGIYLFGVQLPTILINIPLNNKLQTVDVEAIDEAEAKQARQNFEPRWNRSNAIRTVLASVTSLLLISLITKL
jgi:uncharacterized membrane protein